MLNCKTASGNLKEEERMRRTAATLLLTLMLTALPWGGPLCTGNEGSAKEKPALDVPYEPTSYGIAAEMLKMAKVTSEDLVYDLGCGDGRIVIMAAKERGARGVGVDLDPERIKESRENAQAAGVNHQVSFFEQNLFETDISKATVVMLYLWPEVNPVRNSSGALNPAGIIVKSNPTAEQRGIISNGVNLKLRPKLLKELRPGARIVSHSHSMGDWEADTTQNTEEHTLYFFIVPANVIGAWQWVWQGRRNSLTLTQKFQKVQGSLTIGDETFPIMNCSLKGDTLFFSVDRMLRGKKETLSFEGRISGNTIVGKMTDGTMRRTASRWEATRDASTTLPIAE